MKLERSLPFTLLVLAACGGSTPPPSAPGSAGSEPAGADPAGDARGGPDTGVCAELRPDACLVATACTLDAEDGEYTCRPASGACEEGLAQTDRDACEARPDCAWDPGRCYCPADVQCICGGGPPARCVPMERDPASGAQGSRPGNEPTAGSTTTRRARRRG